MAVLAFFEAGGEDRERGGKRHRRTQPLREAGADEHSRALRKPTDQRRDADHDHSGDQDPAPAEQVGGAAAEQHEPAVGEQVAGRHPLQPRNREMQGAADRGKRDVHDRRVDEVKERDSAQQRECELAATRRQKRRLRVCRSHLGEPPDLSSVWTYSDTSRHPMVRERGGTRIVSTPRFDPQCFVAPR